MDNLFDVYVRDMEQWFAGNEDMLSRLYSKADRINKIIQKSELNQDKKDDSEYVVVSIENLFGEFNEKYKDLKEMRVASEVTEQQLREKIKALEIENERLKRVKNNESMTEITNILGIPDMKELSENIEKVLGLVKENINVITMQAVMKSSEYKEKDRHGENSPKFRIDVDNNSLIIDYKSGKSVQELAVKYNMGENGIRERLKRANVWEGRR